MMVLAKVTCESRPAACKFNYWFRKRKMIGQEFVENRLKPNSKDKESQAGETQRQKVDATQPHQAAGGRPPFQGC